MRKRCCIIGYKATGSRLTEGQQHHSGASIEAEQRIYEWFSLGIFCYSMTGQVSLEVFRQASAKLILGRLRYFRAAFIYLVLS